MINYEVCMKLPWSLERPNALSYFTTFLWSIFLTLNVYQALPVPLGSDLCAPVFIHLPVSHYLRSASWFSLVAYVRTFLVSHVLLFVFFWMLLIKDSMLEWRGSESHGLLTGQYWQPQKIVVLSKYQSWWALSSKQVTGSLEAPLWNYPSNHLC
jgi:hypothetical protein